MTYLLLFIINSLCVWRFPDRDIKEIFDGDAYRTVYYEISQEEQTDIEKKLGLPLDPDETEFKFFPVYKNKKEIGTVATHLGKGQYGAIEVVVAFEYGLDKTKFKVRAVRIQRDREKARAALRSPKFLGQFNGKVPGDSLKIGYDIKTAKPGAEKASTAVAFAIKKLTLVFEKMIEKQ